ncbi:glycosyltransferase family 2 protein [Patescibacteria group bacterium]|nr:glycosyltransferase family 2 protein [Patescibacteria group bacterium]
MNKKIPGISVIVPAFNEEKNIASCIKALKNQSLDSSFYEIIVVNNASTDKTALVAQKMGVRVVNELQKGYVFALDRGFREAREEYVAITDADTIVNKDWLKKIYEVFESDPKIGFVGGRSVWRPVVFLSILAEFICLVTHVLFGLGNGFNMAAKRKVWEKAGGFRKEVNLSADSLLAIMAKKQEYKRVFLFNNPAVSSSRHFKGMIGLRYCLKAIINNFFLFFLGKPAFFEFGDVRETKKK